MGKDLEIKINVLKNDRVIFGLLKLYLQTLKLQLNYSLHSTYNFQPGRSSI